jgi:hypothetical protein
VGPREVRSNNDSIMGSYVGLKSSTMVVSSSSVACIENLLSGMDDSGFPLVD